MNDPDPGIGLLRESKAPESWIRERHKGIVELGFAVDKVLFSGRSPFQLVEVVRTRGHGAMLLNDGSIMLSERDEHVYHEMIAHVPLFVHPGPRRVLVIGGGDGGTAREVLRHRGVERVVLVEIDALVVEACREHLPGVSCALDDPRLELRIGDGVAFVRETRERFDVILVDSTDPVGPAAPLFDREFYRNAAGRLGEGGILVTQAESPLYDRDLQKPMLENQRPWFERLHLYLFPTLTYPGGLWSFGFASRGPCPLADFRAERVADARLPTRHYCPAVHRAAFALPVEVARGLEEVLDPLPGPRGMDGDP